MSETYILQPSPRSGKKWRITTPWGKGVDFGATGYSDYTLHKDPSRQDNYLSRHEPREDWTKSGTDTAGFWSRWILWNLPDFMESVKDTESRFGIKIDTSAVTTNSDGSPINGVSVAPEVSTSLPPARSLPLMSPSNTSLPPITTPIQNGLNVQPITSFRPMTSLPELPRSPMMSRKPAPTTPILSLSTNSQISSLAPGPASSSVSLPTMSTPIIATVPPASQMPEPTNGSVNDPLLEDYQACKIEAAERKAKGKLKLCPEGYCTVKITEEVYPSYSGNVRASKICNGQEEDYQGNLIDYYSSST